MNPATNPIVAKSVFPPLWLSGITSSTTIKIIAPAAKDSAYGKIGNTLITIAAPITANIGSTMADNCPHCHDFHLLTPILLSGIDTANPSGKFCIPMPIPKAMADPRVNTAVPSIANKSGDANAPKATPTASPSGTL